MTKKELKEAYKKQQPIMGVFQIRNVVNGKVLIEATTNIPARWNRHRTELRFGSHRNQQLQKDWKKIGEENFEFSVLSELTNEEDARFDPKKEVKLLKEMIEEELDIEAGKKY